ncbi:hypothetical protein [Terrihabitans rhizophilus]|jgi:hypothetical protein|uniref:Uncharacterized protein n=1 Tax=Terrihabitans rhizophilus TaxID=3092662 RepID=A0ABU4RRK7_9HYPH|nr:hypothetical protein [Terrihabitans sp. PJ23]MDX6805396.1 hypothetical protein [Terrihabitans sp. PJ23]
MPEDNNVYKRANKPRKKEPVKRVTLSPEARKAYEEMIREREERERLYGTHLDRQDRR